MGGKKKWGENGGTEKAPIFSKTKKMGNLKKKKGRKMGGIKKPPIFKKWGRENLKKWENALWAQKNTDFCFSKKKMGRKWAQVENPPFSKNGRKKKKMWVPTVFLKKKNPPSSL